MLDTRVSFQPFTSSGSIFLRNFFKNNGQLSKFAQVTSPEIRESTCPKYVGNLRLLFAKRLLLSILKVIEKQLPLHFNDVQY